MSLSLLQSNVQVTGSSLIYQANFSGIGGTIVQWSGEYILVSGAAGGGGTVQSASNFGAGSGWFSGLVGTDLRFYSVGATGTNNLVFSPDGTIYINGTGATQAFVTGVSGYLQHLISVASSGVSSINGLSGALTLNGAAGISILTNGQAITVSGQDWVTSGVLAQSGQAILNAAYVYANGVGSDLSGQLQQTGSTLYGLIINSSGLFLPTGSVLSYVTGVPTGSDVIYFSFKGYVFPAIPTVLATLESDYYANSVYGFMLSGRSTTGFWTMWSDVVLESGYSLNVLAKI